MIVLVTGATGFLGRHIVPRLLERGHAVIATARSRPQSNELAWLAEVEFIECDLHRDFSSLLARDSQIDALVHLAWPGLPNYDEGFHVQENLPCALRFLEAAVAAGVKHLTVAGTCLEYGMQYGPLGEDDSTNPTTSYGLAKDTLRKALQQLQLKRKFGLQWVRLFYMFGPGQNPKSLLAQLDRAIDEGHEVFKMSPGDQLRDYMNIADVASAFARLLDEPTCQGIINCCSGVPISVRQLVEVRCAERGATIRLERGFYNYPAYEPLAFWGVPEKLRRLSG